MRKLDHHSQPSDAARGVDLVNDTIGGRASSRAAATVNAGPRERLHAEGTAPPDEFRVSAERALQSERERNLLRERAVGPIQLDL